ncbi:hypothetical protein PTI45_01163 [Paenibacillus nuruki]|uniref:DUF5655 domain-containing protein n=1 Tax=Paenibacillus nuruki TaxID=1886670 RepID=A0A1E3L9Q3_9BACL|nr:DUF5655 domain-containing protein [Paenibacillus nuruki]ODP29680.1 hypothetical protein PTI45_01163 [Paenibacillus nuruki]
MGDIKLFLLKNNQVEELSGYTIAIEKSLQSLMENNLDTLLGIRFLASEYSTGKRHNGRIDTLGIDENNSPVIIEYKRATNENVINQGLYYLDWLMDHQSEFMILVMEILGREVADAIDWNVPRLLCIAGGFTKYDEHAVQQIDRNISLYTYKRYGEDLFLLDLVNATTANSSSLQITNTDHKNYYKSVSEYLDKASVALLDHYEQLKAYITALGDDVQVDVLKYYIAFKRIKNFACIEIYYQKDEIHMFLKVDPNSIQLEEGFTRNVQNIGHRGTGDLEVIIKNEKQLEKAKFLIQLSYEMS